MTQSTKMDSQVLPCHGSRNGLDELMPLVYRQIRRMAASFLRREREGHTLQPTALANEVYLRFAAQHGVEWKDPAQLIGLASQMMRRILINYAEAHKASKRGPAMKLSLDEAAHAVNEPRADLIALHEALLRLESIDPKKGQIVALRFFGGLTMKEISMVMAKSVATVEREWSIARAWLYREIKR